jgi:hypothetical protein
VLGGLAATTWLAAAALDAAGFDPVLQMPAHQTRPAIRCA